MRGFVFLIVLFSMLSSTGSARASDWIGAQQPVFKQISRTVPESSVTKGCIRDTKFITIPKKGLRPESSYTFCGTPAPYGIFGNNDHLLLREHSIAGQLRTSNNARLPFAISPIPNTDSVLKHNNNGLVYGSNLYVITNFRDKLETRLQSDGSLNHVLKQNLDERPLTDPAGSVINFSNIKFSSNGTWITGNAHLRGIFRVNTLTGESLRYSGGYNHGQGMSPTLISAISNDGRYVLNTENRYGLFKFYDLSLCTPVPDISKPSNCPSLDLLGLAKSSIPGFFRVISAEFTTDHTIKLYVLHDDETHGLYTLSAAGQSESLSDYLALGDSFASGEGAHSYKSGTDDQDSNTCHLSHVSYPYLLAARTSLNNTNSVACSGAKIKDIMSTSYSEHDAQSKGKNDALFDVSIFNGYLPGYRPQWLFAQKTKPHKVTVSIGGNDIGFGKILAACIGPGTCYNTEQERVNLAYTIDGQQARLIETYQKLKDHTATDGTVYVIGYPYLAKENGNCALNVRLNDQEIKLSNQIVDKLNEVVQQAASKASVSYIDTTHAFAGHRLCEADSKDSAVNGLTAGKDKTFSFTLANKYEVTLYLTGRESYHPNQRGNRMLADVIAAHLNKDIKPIAPPQGEPLAPTNTVLTPHKVIFDDSIAPNIMLKNQFNNLVLNNLLPNTPVLIQAGAKQLASAIQSSTSGAVQTNIVPPHDITPGLYMLRITTLNSAGEPIEIQKPTYIAESQDDLDGDGIPTLHEVCFATQKANIDVDEDGIDDACDGYIGKPPIKVSPPVEAPTLTSRAFKDFNIAGPLSVNTELKSSELSVLLTASEFVLSSSHIGGNPYPTILRTIYGPTKESSSSNKIQLSGVFRFAKSALLSLTAIIILWLIIRIIRRKRLQW